MEMAAQVSLEISHGGGNKFDLEFFGQRGSPQTADQGKPLGPMPRGNAPGNALGPSRLFLDAETLKYIISGVGVAVHLPLFCASKFSKGIV